MDTAENQLEIYKFCPNCKTELTLENIDGENVKKCSSCGFVFWNKSKPVISILLYKDGKVLMLQRANEPFKDYWVMPGGFINTKERAEDAVKREVKEETGLDVKIEDILGTYLIDIDPRGLHLDIIFVGKIDGEIKISDEDKKFEFFSPENLPEKIAYKHREAIQDWAKTAS